MTTPFEDISWVISQLWLLFSAPASMILTSSSNPRGASPLSTSSNSPKSYTSPSKTSPLFNLSRWAAFSFSFSSSSGKSIPGLPDSHWNTLFEQKEVGPTQNWPQGQWPALHSYLGPCGYACMHAGDVSTSAEWGTIERMVMVRHFNGWDSDDIGRPSHQSNLFACAPAKGPLHW